MAPQKLHYVKNSIHGLGKIQYIYSLLKKAKRAQARNMWGTENSVIHARRTSGPFCVDDGFIQSIYLDDGIFRKPHVLGLRHAWLL
jgi:hypothetical protein